MQTTLSNEAVGACDILIEEQQRIKNLFRKFEDAESDRQKKAAGDECVRAIEVVLALEEELFYPSVRRTLGERQRVVQALAAHQVAKLLIKEVKSLSAGEQYNARFALLKDNLTQHFESEYAELFPRVERSSMDVAQLGRDMILFKDRMIEDQPSRITARRIAAVASVLAAVGAGIWLARRASSSGR